MVIALSMVGSHSALVPLSSSCQGAQQELGWGPSCGRPGIPCRGSFSQLTFGLAWSGGDVLGLAPLAPGEEPELVPENVPPGSGI